MEKNEGMRTRKWLMIAVLMTALADAATFLAFKQFHIFEINPIFIITQNMLIAVGIKFLLVGLLIWYISKQRGTRTMQYAIVLSAVYICVFQLLGAYSNCYTAATAPPESAALTAEEGMTAYAWVSGLYYLVPVIIATFSFWLFEKLGYERQA